MECNLCTKQFTLKDPNKLPRVLTQCGHTFCDICIKDSMNSNNEITCINCGIINALPSNRIFPINQTLIAILKSKEESEKQSQSESESVCKVHGKLLQAFCQTDQTMVCLNCVLTCHKLHKVRSIVEKVRDDKQFLRQCSEKIDSSSEFISKKLQESGSLIDKLNLDYNEYIFQINLLYKNIINQLKESEQAFIASTKKSVDKSINELTSIAQVLVEKKQFYQQLTAIYHQLKQKQGTQYLKEGNKKRFIIQNCVFKDKCLLPYKKQQISKQTILASIIKSLQQVLLLEKKKISYPNPRKPSLNQSATDKNLKSSRKAEMLPQTKTPEHFDQQQQSLQSPIKQLRKISSNNQKPAKQPHILQVNLVQKYQLYQKEKNMKKKKTEIIVSSLSKSPKIQYQIKADQQTKQKAAKARIYSKKQMSQQRLKNITKAAILKSRDKQHQSEQKKQQEGGLPMLSNVKSEDNSNIFENSNESCQLSFLNESNILSSPSNNKQHLNKTFEGETPFSINSFMESSRFTINENRQETMLKDSRTSFTFFGLQEKVFHFAGLKNDSIDCFKIDSLYNSQSSNQLFTIFNGLNRSKFQCVILNNESSSKCLILGGKDINGQKSSLIFQFDMRTLKLEKSLFKLIQPISGFGAVIFQKKLYVFGGSSSTALKNMYQYTFGKVGFQVKKLTPMINTRDELGFALALDGYIYACGGINSSNVTLNSGERYCFKSNKWHSIPAMKYPRRSFSLVSLPNGLYAIGGHDGKSYLKSVQMYDFECQKWIQVCPMNQGRFTHSALSTSDYQSILVFGGFQNEPLKTSQIFNILQNKWSMLPQMLTQRYLHCSVLIKQ